MKSCNIPRALPTPAPAFAPLPRLESLRQNSAVTGNMSSVNERTATFKIYALYWRTGGGRQFYDLNTTELSFLAFWTKLPSETNLSILYSEYKKDNFLISTFAEKSCFIATGNHCKKYFLWSYEGWFSTDLAKSALVSKWNDTWIYRGTFQFLLFMGLEFKYISVVSKRRVHFMCSARCQNIRLLCSKVTLNLEKHWHRWCK